MEAGVFFKAIEEIDSGVMAGVRNETVERLREHVIDDDRFRQRSIVDAAEYWKSDIVGAISSISRCEEDRRIDECAGHLFDVDAPGVVVGSHIGRLLTLVAIEFGEGTRLLLDDLHADAAVVFELPPELIAVVDVEFTPNPGGDVRLVPRHFAFGVGPVAAHTSR
jgi:hypothetical protein